MSYIKSIVDFTDKTKAILVAGQTASGLQAVYYGPETLTPELPCAIVESGTKTREISGTHIYTINLSCIVTVLYGKIQSSEVNTREDELLAELIEDQLHADNTLAGAVVFCHVTRIDPGRVRLGARADPMFRATRLVFEAISREVF